MRVLRCAIALVVFVLSAQFLHSQASTGIPTYKPYTAALTATFQRTGEKPRIVYREYRWVSSNGAWNVLQEHSSGKKSYRVRDPQRGVFEVDQANKKLVPLTPPSADKPSHNRTAQRPSRHATLLGMDVDVFETATANGSITTFRAPKLGGAVIKLVRTTPAHVFTLETTQLVEGEPDKAKVATPDYPVAKN
jgi:hypothetical protein